MELLYRSLDNFVTRLLWLMFSLLPGRFLRVTQYSQRMLIIFIICICLGGDLSLLLFLWTCLIDHLASSSIPKCGLFDPFLKYQKLCGQGHRMFCNLFDDTFLRCGWGVALMMSLFRFVPWIHFVGLDRIYSQMFWLWYLAWWNAVSC